MAHQFEWFELRSGPCSNITTLIKLTPDTCTCWRNCKSIPSHLSKMRVHFLLPIVRWPLFIGHCSGRLCGFPPRWHPSRFEPIDSIRRTNRIGNLQFDSIQDFSNRSDPDSIRSGPQIGNSDSIWGPNRIENKRSDRIESNRIVGITGNNFHFLWALRGLYILLSSGSSDLPTNVGRRCQPLLAGTPTTVGRHCHWQHMTLLITWFSCRYMTLSLSKIRLHLK